MRDVTIEYNVPAAMRDGTILRADVYRPVGDGLWPVLLARMPYGKGAPSLLALLEPITLARGGFIVALQDTRGRFTSDGDWEPWTFEEQDGHDSVEWAAALPASNGSVGMFGSSYLGNTQWMAALSKPPALKAIAPHVTWSEPHDGLFSRGGALELGLSVPWSIGQGIDTVMRRHAEIHGTRSDRHGTGRRARHRDNQCILGDPRRPSSCVRSARHPRDGLRALATRSHVV